MIFDQVQTDSIDTWFSRNKMKLAMDKCFKIIFIGNETQFSLQSAALEQLNVIKSLGVLLNKKLNWHTHIEKKLKNAKVVSIS